MAQKKRGANPIRITLTEDQISDIIQSAAKTRRGLRVENLEDRIAPSAIGVPLAPLPGDAPPTFDPAGAGPLPQPSGLPGLPGEPALPGLPPIDPLAGSPPTPDFAPGGPVPPPLGGEPPLPFPGTPDPTFGAPPVPDGIPGDPLHPISNPSDLSAPGNFRLEHRQDVFTQHGGILPDGDAGTPDLGGNTPVDPADYQMANHNIERLVQTTQANGGPMPTAEEIDEHRRNILRQLRGA